jgi:hypothetical protein
MAEEITYSNNYGPVGYKARLAPTSNGCLAPEVALGSQEIESAGFSAVGASVLDEFFALQPVVTGGITFSQAAGALSIVASTNTNAEFLAHSKEAYTGSMRLRSSHVLSQRIVNNNFALLLADIIGENLTYTINSSTSVTVAVVGHTFTAQNVGQFVLLGGITGAAGVPGRYAIASVVAGASITFTVAGWPASGAGTRAWLLGCGHIVHLCGVRDGHRHCGRGAFEFYHVTDYWPAVVPKPC